MNHTIVTNGSTLLKKFTCADGFELAGYYNKKIYYTTYKSWDYATLKAYNTASKKTATIKKNCGNVTSYGKYLYLYPITGAIGPSKFQVYNAKTKKLKVITQKMASYSIVGSKLYYAKYVKFDPVYEKNILKVYCCSLYGSKPKTLIKSLKARYISKFGTKSVIYTNYSNITKTKKY